MLGRPFFEHLKYLVSIGIVFLMHPGSSQTFFHFQGVEVASGTRSHFYFPISGETDTTSIPITIFNGSSEGPVLGITAGVYGYEYLPIMAAQKLIHSINPMALSGVVILVQIANLEGFTGRFPYLNPWDGKNLNRAFPGSVAGTDTEKIAGFITNQIISRSDFFPDMHSSGDAPEDLMPYAAYYTNEPMPAISKKGEAMARSSDYDHIVIFNTSEKEYMEKDRPSLYCSAEAFKRGLPSIDIECGRLGLVQPALVSKIEKSVISLLAHLQMLPDGSERINQGNPLIIHERTYMNAE